MHGSERGDDADYAYLYGRISGMSGKLLSQRDVESLIAENSDVEVLASLESTGYEPYLSDIKVRQYTVIDLQKRLDEHLKSVFDEVCRMMPQDDAKNFRIFFTSFWEQENLKTLLRGLHNEMSWNDVKGILNPLGSTPAQDLERLYSIGTVKEFIQESGIIKGESIHQAIMEYEKDASLEILESRIDANFFERLLKELEATAFKSVLMVYADAVNVKNIIRCRTQDIDATSLLIDAPTHLSHNILLKGAVSDINELPSVFARTPYSSLVSDIVADYEKNNSLLTLEEKTGEIIFDFLGKQSTLDPLGVYSTVLFIEKKLKEIKTVSAIILSKKAGFTPVETKQLVYGVS